MTRSRLSQVDLNLLVSLEVLLREMNVTRAAVQLGVTQSAMSHALNRLRAQFDDPLLVRRGGEMTKTALAIEIGADLATALESVERVLSARSTFDPATAVRKFALIAGDYAQITVVEPLLGRLREVAPDVDLVVRTVREPERALGDREYALMLGPAREAQDSLRRQLLFTDRLVCVCRREHPLLQREISVEDYLAARHILVSPRGLPGGIVDDELARRGAQRRVVLDVPSFLTAAIVVSDSDHLVTMPERLADRLIGRFGLSKTPLPFRSTAIEFVALWHERHQSDPAHMWLRGQISQGVHVEPPS